MQAVRRNRESGWPMMLALVLTLVVLFATVYLVRQYIDWCVCGCGCNDRYDVRTWE